MTGPRSIALVTLIAAGVSGCEGPVTIGTRPEPVVPAPVHAPPTSEPVRRGCPTRLAYYEQAVSDLAHRRAEAESPHAIGKPPKRGPKRRDAERPLALDDRLGRDFELLAVMIYADTSLAYADASAGGERPKVLVRLAPDVARVSANVLVRRKLSGGLFEYVWECSTAYASGRLPHPAPEGRREGAPLALVLEETPEAVTAFVAGALPEESLAVE